MTATPSARIRTVLDEGRLIRGSWGRTADDGRELLCLYTALAGSKNARPGSCPATDAPVWFQHLMPWLDDSGSDAAWRPLMERIVAVADRLHLLPPETEWRVRSLCVREAMRHTADADALSVCERVADLCERRGRGEVVPDVEFSSARASALEAAAAAAVVASEVVAASEWAARAAEWAAGAWAAWAAAAAAADRLASAIMDEVERTILVAGDEANKGGNDAVR